ncbi:unnamed protein product [Agarophyton chilense]
MGTPHAANQAEASGEPSPRRKDPRKLAVRVDFREAPTAQRKHNPAVPATSAKRYGIPGNPATTAERNDKLDDPEQARTSPAPRGAEPRVTTTR